MIKLDEPKKTDIERDIDDAKVEEALARWEAGVPPGTADTNKKPLKKKWNREEEAESDR